MTVAINPTNCGEDGQGEETGLDVIPVEREILTFINCDSSIKNVIQHTAIHIL